MSSDPHPPRSRLFAGLRIVSLCTLLSRVLGMVRDIGMATLFGNGPVFDAFSVAFRLPNLMRALFGEGALTAAFLPIFVRELEQQGRPSAWKLASAVFALLTLTLSGLVILGEIVLLVLLAFGQFTAETQLLVGLAAVMLPYVVLICLAAQVSAVLNALGHFTWPALVPVVLNLAWIAAIWWLAPQFDTDIQQIYAVSTAIVFAGILQLCAPLPRLRQLGFRFDRDWWDARQQVGHMVRVMLPVLLGLSITQLNTLCDSLIAWGLSEPVSLADGLVTQHGWRYPLEAGTASALYLGQRLYQFPLGIFGVALGTVLFPLLSRHAERGQLDLLRNDLLLGLKLVIVVGLPSSLGLFILAEPLTTLLFQYGAFGVKDAEQTAGMISAYGIGVWAYCGLLIIHRGYYAVGDRVTPVRVGLAGISVNLLLNFTLIWPMGGRGLAFSTAISSMLQVVVVAWFLQHRVGRFQWSELARTAGKAGLATLLMCGACVLTWRNWPAGDALYNRLGAVAGPIFVSILVYLAAGRVLGMHELWLLFRRDRRSPPTEPGSAESGSTESGSAESGSAESGSAESGSTESGSTESGSTESGP